MTPSDGGSVTLNPSGGTYDENTGVTVTAVAASGFAFKNWAGDLSGTANPTTVTMTGDKVVEAVFEPAQSCTTVNLVAAEDTYMSGYNTDYNYGGVNLFKVTNNNAGTQRGALIRWDVSPSGSGIPLNATISSASLTLYVSTASSQAYNLYNMRRGWVEGTTTPGATSTSSATWETYDGTNVWGTNGAANTSSDRYDTNLWSTTTSTFTPVGSKTINLNTAGVAVIQGWVNESLSNYGLTMQSYSSTSGSDDLQISSSENPTAANRPKLNVTYCIPTASYTLSVGNDTHGTVTVSPVQATYEYGTVVTLTPDAGQRLCVRLLERR